MSFAALFTDTISILKQNGERIDGIKSAVQSSEICFEGSHIRVEPLDLIQRKMSNGSEETFEVIDPGFHEAFHSIPAGYNMKVRKLGISQAKAAIQSVTYNFHGHNARVNQNSIDGSINIVSNAINDHLEVLRDEIKGMSLSDESRKSAEEIIDTVSEQIAGNTVKKGVVKTLLNALPQTANIASVCSLILDTIRG
ncbi:MAG: hypothetical protein KBC53_08860 [Nitrosomonas sp.]|nr:hypothetical protein [Nitrosomonas sp.]